MKKLNNIRIQQVGIEKTNVHERHLHKYKRGWCRV